jgi:hypothetical protein
MPPHHGDRPVPPPARWLHDTGYLLLPNFLRFLMPTFNDLAQRLSNAKFRKTVLTKLIEYIDENFVPPGDGKEAKNALLTDDQVRVPVELFESVVADTLTPELEQLDAEITQIMAAELAPPPPPTPEPEAAPPAPAPKPEQVAPTKKTKKEKVTA